MRILVIGAGVVGVTSAWYLTRDGHEVTVVEAADGPAEGASFGNAGGVCPGFAGPWAAPGMPLKALGWMFRASAPLKLRPRLDPAQWLWLAAFLRNCTASRFAANKARMQRSAHYSKACLVALREELGLEYDNASLGVLQVFASESDLAGGRRAAAVLRALGIPHRLVAEGELAAIEPALAQAQTPLLGGLHLLRDETGDSRLFTLELARRLGDLGCTFRYGRRVTALERKGGRIVAARTAPGEALAADAFVLATGAWAPQLLAPLGLRVPIYPVKGYALTVTVARASRAPRSSVMDEHSKIMITRLGSRIRAAGVAELAGFDSRLRRPALDAMRQRVAALFPEAADYSAASEWCGFRPMTPDGPAIVGRRGADNLFLNLGHGSNGWTQTCGTGRVLADQVAGRPPEVQI